MCGQETKSDQPVRRSGCCGCCDDEQTTHDRGQGVALQSVEDRSPRAGVIPMAGPTKTSYPGS